MAKKKHNEKADSNAAKEPEATYGNKDIVVFNSVEEMNEHDHSYYASLSPEECLAIVTAMRIRRYPHLNTDMNPWGTKIYFD